MMNAGKKNNNQTKKGREREKTNRYVVSQWDVRNLIHLVKLLPFWQYFMHPTQYIHCCLSFFYNRASKKCKQDNIGPLRLKITPYFCTVPLRTSIKYPFSSCYWLSLQNDTERVFVFGPFSLTKQNRRERKEKSSARPTESKRRLCEMKIKNVADSENLSLNICPDVSNLLN